MLLYIHRSGQQYGPFSIAQAQEHVRSGTLALTDLAWYEGLPTWMPLSQIPGFSTPAPVAPFVPPPPPPVTATVAGAYESYRPPKRKVTPSVFRKVWICLVGLVVLEFKFKFLLFLFFSR